MAFFTPNPDFEREIAASPEHRDALASAAQPAAAEAEALAHRIMPRDRSAQIVVEQTDEGVFLINRAYGAWIDEIGSVNSAPYAPLRRGAEAAGLTVTDD